MTTLSPQNPPRIQPYFRQRTACKQAVGARGEHFRLPNIRARVQ